MSDFVDYHTDCSVLVQSPFRGHLLQSITSEINRLDLDVFEVFFFYNQDGCNLRVYDQAQMFHPFGLVIRKSHVVKLA